MDNELERSLECSECRKPIHTCYCIVNQHGIQKIGMCASCPMLKKKLYGQESFSQDAKNSDAQAALCCGQCGLTREEVKMGSRLGCSLCYEIFQDDVLREIIDLGHISQTVKDAKSTAPLHLGKTPAIQQAWDPSVTIVSLQHELQDTLRREDYEQAAWLRDKIQALTKKSTDASDGNL